MATSFWGRDDFADRRCFGGVTSKREKRYNLLGFIVSSKSVDNGETLANELDGFFLSSIQGKYKRFLDSELLVIEALR